MPRPLLIVGAGIGGLSAALLLGRAGWPIILVERRPGFAEEGAGIQLSPNASRILIDAGLGLPLARRAVEPEQMDLRRLSEARAYASLPLLDARMRYGAPFWCVARADLHAVLLDAVRNLPAIRLQVARRITGFSETGDGVVARIANGRDDEERVEVAAIIAADGAHSGLRALAGDAQPAFFARLEAWRTLLPAAAAPAFMQQPRVNLAMGGGRHVVHYPVAAGTMVNVVYVRPADASRDGWANDGEPTEIAGEISGMAPVLADALAAAPDWRVWSLYDRTPPTLARGRVAFVGDAAHPVLPFLAQGGAMAIEDAAVLAAEMAAGGASDPAAAFARYARRRYSRVAAVRRESRANARRYHLGPALAVFRDAFIRLRGPDHLVSRLDWLYGWRV
jgi:salicylate hydroxylase